MSAPFNAVVPTNLRYDPVTNPTGIRGTVYDAAYGTLGAAPSPTFMQPTSVVTPRFMRLNFTFDF